MNFFEPIQASKKKNSVRQRLIIYISLSTALLIAGSYGYLHYVIMEQKSLIAEYNSQLQQSSGGRSEYEEQIMLLNSKKDYLSLLYVMNDDGRVVKTLSYIEENIPNEMVITSVLLSIDNINIQAAASEKADIADFERKLRLFELLEDVHVSVINTENGYTTAISCTYKTNDGVIY